MDVQIVNFSTRSSIESVCVDVIIAGGIGEAVAAAVSGERDFVVKRLAVSGIPRSGKPEELLDLFGISSRHIVNAVKELLKL